MTQLKGIILFDVHKKMEVSTVDEPWFVLKDIADILVLNNYGYIY